MRRDCVDRILNGSVPHFGGEEQEKSFGTEGKARLSKSDVVLVLMLGRREGGVFTADTFAGGTGNDNPRRYHVIPTAGLAQS